MMLSFLLDQRYRFFLNAVVDIKKLMVLLP